MHLESRASGSKRDNQTTRMILLCLLIMIIYPIDSLSPTNSTSELNLINLIVTLPIASYQMLQRMHDGNSSLALQHLSEVNDIVAPYLIESSNNTFNSPPLPELNPQVYNRDLDISQICLPGHLCDLDSIAIREKRSPFKLGSIFKGLKRSRSRIGRRIRNRKQPKKLRTQSLTPKLSRKVRLINKLKIAYGGTGVIVMMGTLGLVSLGIAEYAGWIPHVEEAGQIDFLSSQFQEYAVENARLTQQLYYMTLENSKTQLSTLELVDGLRQEEDITASLSYVLNTERFIIETFLRQLHTPTPRSTLSHLTKTFFNQITTSSGIEHQSLLNCAKFKIVGYIPQRLRVYMALCTAECSSIHINISVTTEPIQINLAPRHHLPNHILSQHQKFISRLNQSQTQTSEHLSKSLALNGSINQLVEKTKNMNTTSIRIWIPTSITTSLVLVGALIIIILTKRKRSASQRTRHDMKTNSIPLSITSTNYNIPPEVPSDYNLAKTTLQNTLSKFLNAELASICETSTQTLSQQYDLFHQKSIDLANSYRTQGLPKEATAIDNERNDSVAPLFLEALAKARKENSPSHKDKSSLE